MSESRAQRMTPTARVISRLSRADWRWVDVLVLIGLVATFLTKDAELLKLVLNTQPLGMDFLPLWTGAKVDPARLYDFRFVTEEQAWLYVGKLRPFVYPPSALLIFAPFALLPFAWAYAAFVAGTGALFLWAGRRLGADWPLMLAAMPILLVALAGQVTFLIGALVMAAILLRGRPVLGGVLFGLAGAIKPQVLVLLPMALLVEGNWRAFWATGATAGACALASLLFGASWIDWLEALPRFTALVKSDIKLMATTLTPYTRWGPDSLWLSVPAALAGVWLAFRRGDAAQRVLALLGGALLVCPYAMNYEIALLIPAVLALRAPLVLSLPFWVALIEHPSGPVPLVWAMVLLFLTFTPGLIQAARGAWPWLRMP